MKGYAAVIVTFNPDKEHVKSMYHALADQVEYIITVDNTPMHVMETVQHDNNYKIYLGDNLGIATAQNVGLRKAIELGCKKCIIFDQDSIIPESICQTLGNDIDTLNSMGMKVACIGPRINDILEKKIEKSKNEIKVVNNCFSVNQIIASGSLFNLEFLEDIGYMEDDLFIDAVDHEWCWRAKKNGYDVCISANIYMQHVIGIDRDNFLFWTYIVCSPIRHYYQFRNSLLLLSRDYVPTKWKIKKCIEILFLPIIFSIKGPERMARLGYMIKGLLNGLLGNVGRMR
ncbi:TPA: glycosyltransferase family 2 protein [Escherichia coli]|uniref:glycosyltransferase family 2 protein n=1 Tax=Escherichia coli TaxID=562 RepID=UPI000BE315A1|nr:glycosyltransferase family 2 protein [Escherichia coli]EFC1954873.1 glycosyltransferase family 2 protein [Escherichia coli]EIP9254783.1 glycosyltransferase family 2 protein [Escherichia coli]MBI1009528.1 glycosyltransferase family 2 protein [Escherichia coli]MBS8672980.1 glycosyltransferase family 2 protein [Escherichia coli]MCN2703472.1 glycosyltransferase family 2 protein [Escherichia coli]